MKKISINVKELQDDYLNGCSVAELMEKYGVSRNTVLRRLHDANIETYWKCKTKLNSKYIVEQYRLGRTTRNIGKELGVSKSTIALRLRAAGVNLRVGAPLPRNGLEQANKTYRNKEWLIEQYHEKKMTKSGIAALCNVAPSVISHNMQVYGIALRDRGENQHMVIGNHVILSHDVLDLLDGLLFSDGSIRKRNGFSATYTHGDKHEDFISWLSETLRSFGIKQSGKICNRSVMGKYGPLYTYHYTSRSYEELVPVYERWYPNGKKRIPRDIVLTPTVCRMEYIGDGTLCQHPSGRRSVSISTKGFLKEDVLFFIEKLKEIGIEAAYWASSNSVGIGVQATEKFLDYILPLPEGVYKSYGYKVDRKLTKTQWESRFRNACT